MAQAQLSKPLLDQESMTIFSIITKEQLMATITKSIINAPATNSKAIEIRELSSKPI